MHSGSKQGSEASFSFQINDAVKGDEEYLLADDDFLRDVNDYTITTPVPPSRTVLERDQQLTLAHLTPGTDDHDAGPASSPPKPFAPSSPTHAKVHHHEAAVTKRLKTPKPTFTFPSKPSTPKTTLVTRSTAKWPSPSRGILLPRPEASPVVARLTNLRAEIEMLGESNGLSHNLVQQQQEDHSSNKRTESGNRSLLNSNIPTPAKIERSLPIEEETLMDENEPRSRPPLVTQSAPAPEPHNLGSSGSCDETCEPVSPDANEWTEVSEPQDGIFTTTGSTNSDGCSAGQDRNLDEKGVFDQQGAAVSMAKDRQEEDPMASLTLSQLSPQKLGKDTNLENHDPAPSPSPSLMMSPMRVPRKRPVSAVTNDHRDETSKKGKMVPRATRNRATDAKNSDAQNPNRPTQRRNVAPKVDRRNQGSMVRRLAGSGSGSRLKSSRLSSSRGVAISSASLASSKRQSLRQKVAGARTGKRVGSDVRGNAKQSRKRKVSTQFEGMDAEESGPSVVNQQAMPSSTMLESNSLSSQEAANIPSGSYLPSCHTSHNNNEASEQMVQEGTTSHVNATRSVDFGFQFRSEERAQIHQPQIEKNAAGMKLRSHSRAQLEPGSGLFKTSSSTSSSSSLSNSRTVASMARSQFRYTHHRPIPDYKAQHALLESSLAQRKENIAPVLPLSFELHTDVRARDRERFDALVKEKEKDMEREREAKRREREEQEEREVRDLRRRAVPKANAVPEWYKNAPRRKKVVEEGEDGEH